MAKNINSAPPDFTGLWARNAFNLDAPQSGPGPVANKMRHPDGRPDMSKMVGDYTNPILKPEAADIVKKRGEISLAGAAFPDPSNQCLPYSPVFLAANNQELQIVQQKNEITILYMFDHQVRRVRLDERHPSKPVPSWYGDSVGHFEGDTLVVDTIGVKVGPLSMVDMYGTPHSEALHVIERYHFIDSEAAKKILPDRPLGYNGDGVSIDANDNSRGLQLQLTVEDPGVFTMPWTASVTYRHAGSEWVERVCAENTREYYANRDTAIPTQNTPDF